MAAPLRGPPIVPTAALSPDRRANSGCIGSHDPRPFSCVLLSCPRSCFRRILDVKLFLRGQPSFEMLSPFSVENLEDDSGHSFRVHPGYLALPAHVRSLRQIKLEIDDRRKL